MLNKKNLRNLGFTLYEVLAVIAIIGVIASMSIPVIILNQKRYNELIFEQNCKMYENVFLDIYETYQYDYPGTTPLTQDIRLRIPFASKIEMEEEIFVDMLDTQKVFYFIYETLVRSNFSYDSYQTDYSPANLTDDFKYFPSVYTLTLENNVVIVYHLEILTTLVNGNQIGFIRQVEIKQNDLSYSFEV